MDFNETSLIVMDVSPDVFSYLDPDAMEFQERFWGFFEDDQETDDGE